MNVLRAQNIALRKSSEESSRQTDRRKSSDVEDSHAHGTLNTQTAATPLRPVTSGGVSSHLVSGKTTSGTPPMFPDSRGNILGSHGDIESNPPMANDDIRKQLKSKWESEKKLQKRLTQLEGK